ncbi:MAG: hypothetical protein J0H98_08100 [Solirubrobacterales bacterium]|nr:hypothetical protein [Solirubrobacterales bacterium]
MNDIEHIFPVEDQHDHIRSEDCVCGTEPELILLGGQPVEVIVHQVITVSIGTLGKLLPDMLTWTEEPGARAGDLFIFKHGVVSEIWEGRAFRSTYPDVYIRLLAHPELRDGVWRAPFARAGFRRPVYLRHGGGTTADPTESLDPECQVEEREKSGGQDSSEIERRGALRQAAQRDPRRSGRHLHKAA